MNRFTLLIIAMLTAMPFLIFGQQKILMNSGEVHLAYGVKVDDKQGMLFYKDKKGHVKWEFLQDVFSYQREDSVHVIFYKADCEDVCFKTEQMRQYLEGYAAAADEKTPWAFISGVGTGALSSFYFVNIGLSILAPFPPAANAVLFGAFRPKEQNFEALEAYKDNPHYTEGYLQRVKKKRTIRSIIGGAVGILGGGAAALFLK